MTDPAGTQWETALLNKLTSNGERIALIEQDLSSIKSNVKEIKEAVVDSDRRLTEAEEILKTVKIILGLTRWIAGNYKKLKTRQYQRCKQKK